MLSLQFYQMGHCVYVILNECTGTSPTPCTHALCRGWQSSNGEQPASGWSGEEEGLEPGEAGAGPAPRGQQHLDRDEHEVDRQSGEGGGDQEEQGGDRLDAVGPFRQQSWVWWSQETGSSTFLHFYIVNSHAPNMRQKKVKETKFFMM